MKKPEPKLIILIVLSFTLQLVSASCSEGCLRCSKDRTSCLVCNIWKHYFLTEEHSCLQIPNTNCLIPDPVSPRCLQCIKDHIIDLESLKCVPLADYLQIKNCRFYDQGKRCLVCDPGYFANGFECAPVNTPISNCQMQVSASLCGKCDDGYALSLDLRECLPHSFSNCAFASNLECKACSSRGFLNDVSFFASNPLNYFLAKKGWPFYESSFKSLKSFSCTKIRSSEHCVEFDQLGNCIKCVSGFGVNLEFGTCQEVFPNIDHCLQFSSSSTCSRCEASFYLKSSIKCEAVTPIDKCLDYDTTSNRTLCSKCLDTHFLENDNVCTPRLISLEIEHCKEKAISIDGCQECESGYWPDPKGSRCLLEIPHCDHYDPNSGSNFLTCLKCADGFYFDMDSATCVEGEIPNCIEYSEYSPFCQKCVSGFFVDNGICLEHQYIHLCQEYSSQSINKCEKCFDPNLLLTFQDICVPFPKVENCKTYTNGLCSNCVSESGLNGEVSCKISEFYQRENVKYSNTQATSFEILGCVEDAAVSDGSPFISRCYNHKDTSVADFSDGTSFVSNCQYYYLEGGSTIKCLQCRERFALLNNSCVMHCGIHPKMLLDTPENGQVPYLTLGVCDTSLTTHSNLTLNSTSLSDLDPAEDYSSPYCTHSSRNFADGHVSATGCVKCLENPDVIPLLDVYSFGSPSATIFSENQKSFHPLYRNVFGLSCISVSQKLPQILKVVKNCSLYSSQTDFIGCIKCNLGYKGVSQKMTADSSDFNHFLVDCVPFSKCNSASTYDGKGLSDQLLGPINLPLESVISCFECTSSTDNLIYFGKVNKNLILPMPYSTSVPTTQTLSTGTGDHNMQCLTQAELTSIFSSATLVTNCALFFSDVSLSAKDVSVDSTTGSSTTGFHCLACKNGFRPTFFTNSSTKIRVITACTAISSCDLSSHNKTFNNCTKCQESYVFPKISNKIDFANCTAYPASSIDSHCLVMDSSSSKCRFCEQGYSPNYEGLCDLLKQPFCSGSSLFYDEIGFNSLPVINSDYPNIKDFSFYYPLIMHGFRGCGQCADGFSPLVAQSVAQECVRTNRLLLQQFTPVEANKAFIPNCESLYFNNGVNKCYKCRENYIILSDHSGCVLSTDSTRHCSILNTSDDTQCTACSPPAVRAGTKCLVSVPENCTEFAPKHSTEILECSSCVSGYYLNTVSNTCNQGDFPYCKVYENDNPEKCLMCMESFMLVTLSGESQCLYIPHASCLGLTKSGSNQLSCSECPPFSKLSPLSSLTLPTIHSHIFSFCFPKSSVAHCLVHSSSSTLSFEAPTCLQCQSGFYLSSDSSSCIHRTKLDPNCLEYFDNNQDCKTCREPYFLSSKECVMVNSVAQNCAFFLDLENCQECDSQYYLSAGRCFEAVLISNCSVWETKDTCKECTSGFAPSQDSGSCKEISTPSCSKTEKYFDSPCIQCISSFHLHIDNKTQITSCIKIEDPNCEAITSDSDQTCITCKKNFTIGSDKKCTPITETIPNCHTQTSNSTCSRCKPGFYLTQSKSDCVPLSAAMWHMVDPACSDIQALPSAKCMVCQRGHRNSVSGECLDCSHLAQEYLQTQDRVRLGVYLNLVFEELADVEEYFEHTCDVCSAQECLLCGKEYYMDSLGFCRGFKNTKSLNDQKSSVVQFTNPYNYELEFGGVSLIQILHFLFFFLGLI